MSVAKDSDLRIRDDAMAELAFDPRLDAAAVGVAVRDGVATLTGQVLTFAEKVAAEAAVRRVKGVRAVVQDIEVRLADVAAVSDETIASRAADILSWCALPRASPIHVAVHGGWIDLTGQVEWAYQREEAERSVRTLEGVRGVRNEIAVKPSLRPAEVEKHIARAFHRNAELERSHVQVEVDGSTVTLSGQVKTWYEQDTAERAAWSTPGVTAVVNDIRIG